MKKGSREVVKVVFDARGSNSTSWMSMDRVIPGETSYIDMYPGQTNNIFTVEG